MKALVKGVCTSRATLAALVLCIVLLSTLQNGLFGRPSTSFPRSSDESSIRSIASGRDLQEMVMHQNQHVDANIRKAVKARRQSEADESAIARRSVDKNDGGSDAVAADGGAQASQNVHVHVIAVGDSLTEGVLRIKEATTKLVTSPYVDAARKVLMERKNIAGGDCIVSATSQVFGFRGKTAGGIVYEAGRRMFASEQDRANLIPAAIPADLRQVLLNHQDSERGTEAVHRVVLVCSVLGGTNDLLRTAGSTVAPTLRSVKPEETIDQLILLHGLCADYARAMAKRTVAPDAPLYVQVLLLPIGLPPAMVDPASTVHQRLTKSLDGKRNSIRATYGYCTTPETSWRAMLDHRRAVNDMITSPGRFVEALEALAQKLRVSDGGSAIGKGDVAFARELLGEGASTVDMGASGKKPIVTMVSKEVVVLEADALPDDALIWSDCLHLTPKGYLVLGSRVGAVIQQQL